MVIDRSGLTPEAVAPAAARLEGVGAAANLRVGQGKLPSGEDALLALSVIIALFGIVNTLALSVYERTRELGLLRAVGTSRRQIRQIVRGEAVITAVMGAVLGVALGVLFGVLVSRPLGSEGFVLALPYLTLGVLLVLGALAGVVAAIAPARRASRVDVLDALTHQ